MDSIVEAKSRQFAIRIVKVYKHLCEEKHEFVMSKQLLRSGTSIGANIAEALCAISTNDFLAKMYIAFKESAETQYWLTILYESNYFSKIEYDSLAKDCKELIKLLSKITETTREKLEKEKSKK